MLRDDLSTKLIHLARGDDAADRFRSILATRQLNGGSNFIRGGYRCVCFSEAPISKLATVLSRSEEDGGMRYKPFGVMVDKEWLFERGGRPVIYQREAEYERLHEEQRYRHVRYEPPAQDFTWEREWRIRIDTLPLEPPATTCIVPDRRWVSAFLQSHIENVAAYSAADGYPDPQPFPWHFIALTDLGLDVPDVPAPD